ncbi:hydroxyacylglutathione hydrolase [Fonsecaea nubica]|uniref:hydroxyacylglutathione hydrolase n=1 Tax=Fonsecaea nubica TaxID=856822 RepID=A0A178D8D7_9EURO|nr:hydroxyacylglutathione hydrolase [Fonsecaea nubica]OAL37624.1 hydroxyacylglutathione hydrolase [Fonsecaea nubica]
MPSFYSPFLTASTLPDHCTPTSPFLSELSLYLGFCIPSPLAALSTLLGTLSIVSWLFAQMPQIFKNYYIKSTAGLSIFFLSEWLLGDLANLLGAIFTKQAGWQVIVATYYVFVDMCLVFQYFWYSYAAKWIYEESLHSTGDSDIDDADSAIINGLSPINSNFGSDAPLPEDSNDFTPKRTDPRDVNVPHFSAVNYREKKAAPQDIVYGDKFGSSWIASPSPRTLLYAAIMASMASNVAAAPVAFPSDHYVHGIHLFRVGTPLEVAGTILSWCSTFLYLGSRLPQLYKNWQRQSTAGLSPLLFIAAFCGNFFYSASLITNPNAWNDYEPYGHHGWVDADGNQRWAWVARAAPFFLGAAGVLMMDALMGAQFIMYGEREDRIVKIANNLYDLGVGSSNNYAYFVSDDETKDAVIIDPANPPEVLPVLEEKSKTLNLTAIMNTHHHWDHAGGNKKLLSALSSQLPVIGGKDCEAVTKTPAHGSTFSIGKNIQVTALHTPCHTQDSICWFMEDKSTSERVVFTGDTLFIGGCGKFFEGNGTEMNKALNDILASLPDDTKVYPGHEYTKSNVKFLKKVDGNNEAVKMLEKFADENRETQGKFTIGQEKEHNVFMRVKTEEMKKVTGKTEPSEVMAQLREMKNAS